VPRTTRKSQIKTEIITLELGPGVLHSNQHTLISLLKDLKLDDDLQDVASTPSIYLNNEHQVILMNKMIAIKGKIMTKLQSTQDIHTSLEQVLVDFKEWNNLVFWDWEEIKHFSVSQYLQGSKNVGDIIYMKHGLEQITVKLAQILEKYIHYKTTVTSIDYIKHEVHCSTSLRKNSRKTTTNKETIFKYDDVIIATPLSVLKKLYWIPYMENIEASPSLRVYMKLKDKKSWYTDSSLKIMTRSRSSSHSRSSSYSPKSQSKKIPSRSRSRSSDKTKTQTKEGTHLSEPCDVITMQPIKWSRIINSQLVMTCYVDGEPAMKLGNLPFKVLVQTCLDQMNVIARTNFTIKDIQWHHIAYWPEAVSSWKANISTSDLTLCYRLKDHVYTSSLPTVKDQQWMNGVLDQAKSCVDYIIMCQNRLINPKTRTKVLDIIEPHNAIYIEILCSSGSGIGQLLMKQIQEWADSHNHILILSALPSVLFYYRKLGFRHASSFVRQEPYQITTLYETVLPSWNKYMKELQEMRSWHLKHHNDSHSERHLSMTVETQRLKKLGQRLLDVLVTKLTEYKLGTIDDGFMMIKYPSISPSKNQQQHQPSQQQQQQQYHSIIKETDPLYMELQDYFSKTHTKLGHDAILGGINIESIISTLAMHKLNQQPLHTWIHRNSNTQELQGLLFGYTLPIYGPIDLRVSHKTNIKTNYLVQESNNVRILPLRNIQFWRVYVKHPLSQISLSYIDDTSAIKTSFKHGYKGIEVLAQQYMKWIQKQINVKFDADNMQQCYILSRNLICVVFHNEDDDNINFKDTCKTTTISSTLLHFTRQQDIEIGSIIVADLWPWQPHTMILN
jgi:hypothetical protein